LTVADDGATDTEIKTKLPVLQKMGNESESESVTVLHKCIIIITIYIPESNRYN